MRMRTIIIISVLAIGSLQAAPIPESGALSSTNAAYDGNALVLTGQVRLDHGLGQMAAERASLERQETNKDFPFSLIHLQKEVLLTLKNNSEVRCDRANLDFVAMKGTLYSKENEKVIYSDTLTKKKGDKAALRLLSKSVELGMSKKEEGEKAVYDIQTLLAKEEVIIDYASSFTLYADQALYRKNTASTASKNFQGTITAYPKDTNSKCRLIHEGDKIDADSMDLDLVNSKLSMHRPQGMILSSFSPHQQKGEIHFHSDYMTWDHIKNVLTLKGNVEIEESALGTLTSDEELQIVQTVSTDKRLLKGIYAKGNSSLLYEDPVHHTVHKLRSKGPVRIDREHLNATIDSPIVQGKVPEDKQIYYEDDNMLVRADNATLDYSLNGSSLQPVSLGLKGNIRLTSKESMQEKRCALADRLSYSPATHTLILSANPGKKVLFWDEGQSLQVSAHEVHITQDPQTGKESIKGLGNVQFALTVEEKQKLQTIFTFTPEKLPFVKDLYE